MPDTSRIEELQRRVQRDPASIAFAQLAEEYRRAGRFHEAIETCESGLAHHPGYLSARVTLGRSLLETGELESAQQQLNQVLRAAPENLAALRGVAEIHHRRGELREALAHYRAALEFARHDPELEHLVEQISHALEPQGARPVVADGLSFEEVKDTFLSLSLPETAGDPEPAVAPDAVTLEAQPGAEPSATPGTDPTAAVAPSAPLDVEEPALAIELPPDISVEGPSADVAETVGAAQSPDPDHELEAIVRSLSEGVSCCPASTAADADPATDASAIGDTSAKAPAESEAGAREPLVQTHGGDGPEALLTSFDLTGGETAITTAAEEPAAWELPPLESAAVQVLPAWELAPLEPPAASPEPLTSLAEEYEPAWVNQQPLAALPVIPPTAAATNGAGDEGAAPQIEALQKWLDAIIADRQRQG